MIKVYIGLGSNLKNPVLQIESAMTALKSLPDTTFICASSLYQTTPVGFLDQPDFINAVVALETFLNPQQLLSELLFLEKKFGRIRNQERNQPRVLDLDILLYGDEIINDENLIVPHPRLKERSFVLDPLIEISPELRLPSGELLKELREMLLQTNQ